MALKDELLNGTLKLAIWGGGYIGFSTSCFYARQGVSSLIIDTDEKKVATISKGQPPYHEIRNWLGFDTRCLTELGLIEAHGDWRKALKKDYKVHFICVNTEKKGKPWEGALKDVCQKIGGSEAELIIVESTLQPGWTDEVIIPLLADFHSHLSKDIVVAPRRDWFTLPGMNIETLDRVVGGVTEGATERGRDVLSIVSSKIHSTGYREAELVKVVENAYRYLGIMFAYGLTLAYPRVNIREVLQLAATKWNVDLYYPSIGTGGYCLPIALDYILKGAKNANELSLLISAKELDTVMPLRVSQDLVNRRGFRNFGVLGLAYKGNLKVHVLSPSLRLIEHLQGLNASVKINDPLYSDEEIRKICEAPLKKTPSFGFPLELDEFECVIIACDHDMYKAVPKTELFEHLKNCKLILDCHGVWKHLRDEFEKRGIEYHLAGEKGWLLTQNRKKNIG